jgi:hypothetical protein
MTIGDPAAVRAWMSDAERWLQAAAQRAVSTSAPGPGALALLTNAQHGVRRMLGLLIAMYWRQGGATRAALIDSYLDALHTAKLVADDVFIEARHAARQVRDTTAEATVTATYVEFIEAWIKGSPLLNPKTQLGNEWFIPTVRNHLAYPWLRDYRFDDLATDLPVFRNRVEGTVRGEVARLVTPGDASSQLSAETTHLLGLLFLRAQLDLHRRWLFDMTNRPWVDSWYRGALTTVDSLRRDVLDAVAVHARQALVDGDPSAEPRLGVAHGRYIEVLATRYSMHTETGMLFTFFVRQHARGKFASEDAAVGVNSVTEMISAYAGRPDPDNQDARSARSVEDLLANGVDFIGTRVRAFGLLDTVRMQVASELRPTQRIGVIAAPSQLLGFLNKPKADRRVLVDGVLTQRAKKFELVNATLLPHSNAYVAGVGFPLRTGQPFGEPLRLLPSWRRIGPGIQAELAAEQDTKSVADIVCGQQQLVTDLLHHEKVREAFHLALRRSARHTLDLQHTPTRTRLWKVLFAEFMNASPERALDELFMLMRRYLTFYTRHTYFNLRDSGPNYVTSKWPTDLTGSAFHDCGVYAVRTAYDIYHAVNPAGVRVEYRFVTFLNHVCLVGMTDDRAFLVNNDKIEGPRPIRRSGGSATEGDKVEACFRWAEQAYADVYDVDFTIFPAVVPTLAVATNQAEPAFRTAVMSTYLNSIGWSVASPVAARYFGWIEEFDERSRQLYRLLADRSLTGEANHSQKMTDATDLARRLYGLACAVADKNNFVIEPQFAAAKGIPAVGFANRAKPTVPGVNSLPMYDLVDLLRTRGGLTKTQAALIRNPVRLDHARVLTTAFRDATPCPPLMA